MLERILVPLDGSAMAEAILAHLNPVLRRKDGEIILFRALPPDDDPARRRLREYVDTRAHILSCEGIQARGSSCEGAPAEAILEAADRERVGMIAMSTHGRSGMSRWMMGSVAEKVVRASRVPVLLVRSFRNGASGGPEPAPHHALPFKKILMPTDGSEHSLSVAAHAAEFAAPFGAEIISLYVESAVKTPVFANTGPLGEMMPTADAWFPAGESAEDVARRAADRFAKLSVRVDSITVAGDPACQILEMARTLGVDLIAMATHGRSGFSRWLLGSVTEKVLRSAEVPLLIVRPEGAHGGP